MILIRICAYWLYSNNKGATLKTNAANGRQ